MAGRIPEMVVWSVAGGTGDLFAASAPLPDAPADAAAPRVSPPGSWTLRARQRSILSGPFRAALPPAVAPAGPPGLLDDAADRDVRRMDELVRTVRRDMHKMRAFLRFRAVQQEDGTEHRRLV